MEHRPLGRTGVQVSKLRLGAMMFGAWGNTDHDDCIRIIHRALDSGISFVDTADIYSQGESEAIVGKALAGGRRDDVVLATKAWGPMGDDPNLRGVSRRWIIREVESSLRRLNTDWIDLYQIHRYEPRCRHRGDARRAHGPRPSGQGPLHRLLGLSHPRPSWRRSGPRANAVYSATSARSPRTRCWPAGSRPTYSPPACAMEWA
jgi:aryl-alcohol dehydrogenase-like predicted oxidoreductase